MAVTTNKDGYCDDCQSLFAKQKAQKDERLPAHKRGYNYKWKQFSKKYLENHPVCVMCGAPATVTDHCAMPADVMLRLYGEFVYDEEMYVPLCHSCNTRKGLNEDKKIREEWERQEREMKLFLGEDYV